MFKSDTFKDQIILVTGGRSGIGFQIAKDFLQLGAKVIICSRKEDQLKTAAEQLASFGEISWQACDIRKTEDIQALANMIKEKHKRLDVLVNNAGGQFPALAEYINDKGWNAVINNNLNGTFSMIREMANTFFIPQKNGIIVNIIADVFRGFPGMAHTGAARAGVENLTKTLAQEWSDFNIRINCVAPGIIESSGLDNYPKQIQDMFEEAQKAIPLKRFGKVEDVSNAVTFLASSMAAYVTGISLYVDGAQHLNFDKMGLAKVLKSFIS
ncbi:SDR family oxidoreductase [Aquimarina sp. AU474]|uniref:SDR family oxidoreductase n=1 Tax=Aquimarina sp. AU474 TaxID=2108529 RepID=UPI000D6881BA|nr:SDR family oxidoreductase [Aquimarina sp. AU474]